MDCSAWGPSCCSSFESCTSLRLGDDVPDEVDVVLQFFRELHFIEATRALTRQRVCLVLQFFRELHFIEASRGWKRWG